MVKKSSVSRQEAIQTLVKKKAISDQNELVQLLEQHYGIEANQAVVSRDLRKLGIVKKMVNGDLIYEVPQLDVATEILRLALVDVSYNESMIVIQTYPALADFVGDWIDQHDDLDVLGCLAGENVVFVSPKSIQTIHKTYEKLCEKFHFKKKRSS